MAKAIKIEEERYAHTTKLGLEKLEEAIVSASGGEQFKFREWKLELKQRAAHEQPRIIVKDVTLGGNPSTRELA